MILIITIGDIIKLFEKQERDISFNGNINTELSTFSSINDLQSNSVSWIKKGYKFNLKDILEKQNILIITDDKNLINETLNKVNIITCDNPRDYFFSILSEFFPKDKKQSYIADSAIVESEDIHPSVYIGANSSIGKNVRIGANTVINSNITIEGNVVIGANCIIQSGVVLGSDGFGYYNNYKDENTKIEHYGGIIIGDNVEIGSNTCVDKGTFSDTIIGNNVKLGNICHIAHNVIVESNVLIAARASISGSTIIKRNAYIAPGATIRNKITLGEKSFVGLGSVVVKDVRSGVTVTGVPAKEINRK